MMGKIYSYIIPVIPDCSDYRLTSLFGGKVREEIFRSQEHLLRMIAHFDPGRIACAVRFHFNPDLQQGPQKRLVIELVLKIPDDISEEVVRQLIESGPLCEFYQKQCLDSSCQTPNPFSASRCRKCGALFELHPQAELAVDDFRYACEILRQEDTVEATVPREINRYIPGSGFYYSPALFEARADNDFLMFDTLLSKIQAPALIELLATPVDNAPDLQAHDRYMRQLMAVNQYGDDVYLGLDDQPGEYSGSFLEEASPQYVEVAQQKKKDPIADEILREQQEFQRSLRQPQLLFHIKALAMTQENALMLASMLAESGFLNAKYNLVHYGVEEHRDCFVRSLADSRMLNVSLHTMDQKIWNDSLPEAWHAMSRLCRLATVDELKGIFRLPVGGTGSPRCIPKATDPDRHDPQASLFIGHDGESEISSQIENSDDLSALFENPAPTALELRLPLDVIPKHLFVSGVPGSGKTTAVLNLLVQLHRKGIPFLVIEPAKTEYRVLATLKNHPDPDIRSLAETIQVYTPGNDAISPLRFNPLEFPVGISVDEHIDQLLACFEAAIPLGGPLQALIAEAVEQVYKDRGKGPAPRMHDLVAAAQSIMASKSYEGEVKSNLGAAIEVRLGMLIRRSVGRIFQCSVSSPSIADILSRPCIIELEYLSQNYACLLTLFLLATVREHIRVDPTRRAKGLHHVTVIEEAHNIVGRTGEAKASEEVADPKAFAAQYISRMLAELRALGEGIIIADQLPSAVAPEVVKNTGTKLAHRLVSNDDREQLGGAMLLAASEIQELARLRPGEAYFYSEGLYQPRRVRCLNANAYLHLDAITSEMMGAGIVDYIGSTDWFGSVHEAQAIHTLSHIIGEQPLLLAKLRRAAEGMLSGKLFEEVGHATKIDDEKEREMELLGLLNRCRDVKNQLVDLVTHKFIEQTLEPQMQLVQLAAKQSEDVKVLLQRMEDRYNSDIGSVYGGIIDEIDELITKIQNLL
jgi:ribosomal protein L40E